MTVQKNYCYIDDLMNDYQIVLKNYDDFFNLERIKEAVINLQNRRAVTFNLANGDLIKVSVDEEEGIVVE